MTDSGELSRLLVEHRDSLLRFVRRHGSGLLRYESPDDLVQGVHTRALAAAGKFEYRGEADFLGWITRIARAHIADRHEHWSALKRGRGRILRLTWSGSGAFDPSSVRTPAGNVTGPSTQAAKREQLLLVVKVLSALPPRDQKLVRWSSQAVPLKEQAERLDISYEAAQRAGMRAMERFKKTFQLAMGGGRRA